MKCSVHIMCTYGDTEQMCVCARVRPSVGDPKSPGARSPASRPSRMTHLVGSQITRLPLVHSTYVVGNSCNIVP